jgi:hypothetical protein
MYRFPLRNYGPVSSSISSQKDVERNQIRGRNVGDLNELKTPHIGGRQVNLTLSNHFAQSLSVLRKFSDRFAIVPGLPSPVINRECKMVSRYRAGHSGAKGLDSFYCCSRRGVLEDDTKPREVGMEFP